jgi:hypothetical protein
MSFADTSYVQVGYIEESSFGVTPAGTFQEIRITGESLNDNITTAVSEEIRSDRMVPDVVIVDSEAGGDINIELSMETFDDLFQGQLFSTWSASASISSSSDITFTDANTITSSGSTFSSAGFVVGQWIKVTGSSVAGNNNYFKIASISTSGASIDVLPASLSTSSTSTAVTIYSGGMIRNGVTKRSYSFEKNYSDVGWYRLFNGMRPGGCELNFEAGSILKGSMSFLGKAGSMSSATASSATYTAANSNPVLNAVDNLVHIYKDGVVSASSFMALSLALDNGLRGQKAIGTLGNAGIGAGRGTVTGSVSTYLEDDTWYSIYKNATPFALSFVLEDTDGNGLIVTFPRVKLTASGDEAAAIDEDVMYELEWQAIRDAATNSCIQLDRFRV